MMNGMSDVRLTLQARELEQEQRATVSLTPARLGDRWNRLWMRLHTRRRLLELEGSLTKSTRE